MAERRMFAKKIVTSDLFLDMPMSAKFLYFMLGMLADDDGFVDSPNSIMRQTGTTQDDLRVLLSKCFVRAFESGVIVVTAWRVNNYLRNDRYTPTVHVKEFEQLSVDKSGIYTDGIPSVYQRYTNGIPSIGKVSVDKDNISQKTRACACEKKAENGALTVFLQAHPMIKNDLASEIPFNIDWAALGRAIAESEWLQQCTSIKWLIDNYDKVLAGVYKTFKVDKTQHFEAERKYTAEELNVLYKNIDDIEF